MRNSKHRKSSWRIWPLLLIPVFVSLTVISAIELIRPSAEQNDFNELSAIVHSSEPLVGIERKPPAETQTGGMQPEIMEGIIETGEPPNMETEVSMLDKYIPVYEMNTDLFGWIYIDGTVVDYPVMHSPDEPEQYLRKNVKGEFSLSGVPFMAADCYEGCGNYILYGHNMKNGSMFHTMMSYADETFWKEHPTIGFDTLYQTGAYKVYAAFYSKAYYVEDEGVFRVYEFTEINDEATFCEFADQAKKASIYDTGVEAECGDTFITLITCSYHTDNGRFVVIAVKDKESQDAYS